MSIREKLIIAERNISKGKFSEAAQVCIYFLQILEGSTKYSDSGLDFTDADGEMSMLATVITNLLTNASYNPSNKEVHDFLLFKRALSQGFELSKYRSSAHLFKRIGEVDNGEKWTLSSSDICRLFMGLSINAATSKVVDILRACDPTLAFLSTIAFLSEQFTWSEQAEEVRSQSVTGDYLRDNVKLEGRELKLLASAWMGCSYADAPQKHVIKDRLNAVVRNWLRSRGVKDEPGERISVAENSRPKVLIIAELYYKDHAMDRGYTSDFHALRKHFHTTLMMAAGKCDPAVAEHFDEVDSTEFSLEHPERFLAQARAHSPDIVYFPSVGMRIGAIACANVRLAPIQVASLGHPATMRSPFVDFVMLMEGIIGNPACFTETLLIRPKGSKFMKRSDTQIIKPEIRRNSEPVRLAVPAWVRKLSPGFLSACKEIVEKTSRPVEFWFFPNVRGSLFLSMKRRLEELLPARVFPSTDYNQYISNINACDIHLSTFPFGATNGIVDSARQGLPIVNMYGPETHSCIDRWLAGRLNQPNWLTTEDAPKYIDAVVRLVEDHDLRVTLSEATLACEPDLQFFLDDDDETDDIVKIFLTVLDNHKAMQASGKKMWLNDELLAIADKKLKY